ncbi:hypothetical protein [Halomonas sp.]|uniref:hypothetical protein n=1 Tax=Halomonas sp. TaxID=1486246 RepID=UPI0035694F43
MQNLLNLVPEVVVGDIEMLFLGATLALGAPKLTKKVLKRRYGGKKTEDKKNSQ